MARRWSTRRFGWTWKRRGVAADAVSGLGQGIGGVDLQEGALVVVAALAAALIVIPLLFFGLELIVLGALLAAGVVGRVLLQRPWVIEARSSESPHGWTSPGVARHRVAGVRQAHRPGRLGPRGRTRAAAEQPPAMSVPGGDPNPQRHFCNVADRAAGGPLLLRLRNDPKRKQGPQPAGALVARFVTVAQARAM